MWTTIKNYVYIYNNHQIIHIYYFPTTIKNWAAMWQAPYNKLRGYTMSWKGFHYWDNTRKCVSLDPATTPSRNRRSPSPPRNRETVSEISAENRSPGHHTWRATEIQDVIFGPARWLPSSDHFRSQKHRDDLGDFPQQKKASHESFPMFTSFPRIFCREIHSNALRLQGVGLMSRFYWGFLSHELQILERFIPGDVFNGTSHRPWGFPPPPSPWLQATDREDWSSINTSAILVGSLGELQKRSSFAVLWIFIL